MFWPTQGFHFTLKPLANPPSLWLRRLIAVGAAVFVPLAYVGVKSSSDQNAFLLWWLLVLLINVLVVSSLIGQRYAVLTWLLSLLALVPFSFPVETLAPPAIWSMHTRFALVAMFLLGGIIVLVDWLKDKKYEVIAEREKHYHRLVDLSLHPLVLKDKSGQVNYVSQSIKSLLGIAPKEILGQKLISWVHEEDRAAFEVFCQDMAGSNKEPQSQELRMRRKDGSWLWVKNTVANYLHDSAIQALVVSFQDITKQKHLAEARLKSLQREKQARREAEKAVQSRDEFLSIASHELRTPLTTILLQLQATIRRTMTQTLADFSGDKLLKSLNIAEQQSQRLSLMMKDLLNVSLITTGRIELQKQLSDLVPMVRSLAEKFEAQLKLANCRLELELPESLKGTWDMIRVEQALSNLLTNAMKYGQGKPILISASKHADKALISVTDQGLGVNTKEQAKIFELFHRAENGQRTKGLGVGLFIVKQIVESHGGEVRVESKPGKGSTFTLVLPVKG